MSDERLGAWPEELMFPGQPVELGSNRPVVLHADAVWLCDRGDVDVFSVLLAGGEPIGPRRHVGRVGDRRLLLGAVPVESGRGLVAVGANGTRLLCAPWRALWQLLEEPRTAARARALVADCAGTYHRTMASAPSPSPELDEAPAAELCKQLARLAAATLEHADRAALAAEKAALERSERLSIGRQATVERACLRLADTLTSGPGPRDAQPGAAEAHRLETDDALMACCRIVAAALDVNIKPPPEAESARSSADRLTSILRSSRLRARNVALRGDWWRHDHGPLLAFAGEEGRPLALLFDAGRYLLHDPTAGSRSAPLKLDAAGAATLAPFARMIYRPFPETPIGVRALVAFAKRGSGTDFMWIVLMAILAALLGMLPPIATGLLFDKVIPSAHRSQLWQMSLLLIACGLTSAGFSIFQGLGLVRIQQRTGNMVQAAVWDRLMRLPLPFFRPYTAGDLALRAMSIAAIQQILSNVTVTAVLNGIFSLGNVALMFWMSPHMAWRAVILLGIAVAITLLAGLANLGPEQAATTLRAKTNGLVLQLLTGISKLRVAGAEARAFSRWVDWFAAQRRVQLKTRRIAGWLRAFTTAFPVVAAAFIYMAALPVLGIGAGAGSATLGTGDFLAFGAAFTGCLSALLVTCSALVDALDVVSLYDQARPILQTLPEASAGRNDPGILSGDIRMQQAVFRYTDDGTPILRDVSFHVNPGELVAFVGPSGSGKSTILKLLLGFEMLESGSIYYDGQDLASLDVLDVRRQIGVVLQSSRLFAGDIYSNIAASGNATLDEAWEAAAQAGIADDIRAMPMKMHTLIGEQAGTMSGGQKQRLMIARALVNRPRILLFDEATSALDNRTQAIVTASLQKLKVTRIVVAHRLSTIANADRIYVFERGRIVQSGNYGELIKERGAFAELARRQMM